MAVKMSQEFTMDHVGERTNTRAYALSRSVLRYAPLALVGALVLTGCQRTSGFYSGDRLPRQQQPISLEPAPLTSLSACQSVFDFRVWTEGRTDPAEEYRESTHHNSSKSN